jgi:hypothetical protein
MLSDSKRLKTNGEFKDIENNKVLYEDDMIFNSWYDSDYWLTSNPEVSIGDIIVKTKPSSRLLGSPTIGIRPHRITKPKKNYVTIDEIRAVLLSGDDSHYNMLVLDFDGFPHLISQPSSAYAVRQEGFAAGNGYVGRSSSLNHLKDTYLTTLEAWLLHLECDKSIYRDYRTGKLTEDELIKNILLEIDKFE